MEKSESECAHKNINKEKDAKNEAEYEEPTVTYDTVIKELSYFNIFECGNNILNRLNATYKQSCMATPTDKFYTKIYETLVDYNDRNNAPFSNENILQAICKVRADEEADSRNITLDAHNVTVDNFCQMHVTPNTQGDNENLILTRERLNNLDFLAETLKVLTINDAGYYDSD